MRGGHIEYKRRPSAGNVCEDFERELDEMIGEKLIQAEAERAPLIAGETIQSELLGDAVFRPDTPISLPNMGNGWRPMLASEQGSNAAPAQPEICMEDILGVLNPAIRKKVARTRPR